MPHIHELFDFTTSAFVLHPNEDKICLHFHKKLNKWLQPGGHIELNEDPLEALYRELSEEIGFEPVDFEILELVQQPIGSSSKNIPIPLNINVHNFNESHKHIDLVYLAKAKKDKLEPKVGESQIANWFSLEQIRELHKKGEMFDGTLDICEWIFEHHV